MYRTAARAPRRPIVRSQPFLGSGSAALALAAAMVPVSAVALDFSRPGESVGAWKDPAQTPHPRIWMTPERLAGLRARRPAFGKGILADAMTYLVHGKRAAGLNAVAWARKRAAKMTVDYDNFGSGGTGMNRSSRDLIAMALVYDYCHDLLTDADRDQIIKYINACHDGLKVRYVHHMDNYLICPMMTGIAALATAERNPRAQEIFDHHLKVRWVETVKPLLQKFGDGGGWWEGEGYGYEYSALLIMFCEAVYTASGRNLFAEAEEFFFDRLRYLTLAAYPLGRKGARLLFMCGDQGLSKNYDTGYRPRAFLAYHYRDTDLGAGALDMIRQGYAHQYSDHRWVTAFNSVPAKGVSAKAMPLDHFAPGTGRVLARSDWSNSATTVTFMADDHVSWHDHMDSGHFNIYRHDLLTAQSGSYSSKHFKTYYKRSTAKNCISVFMPGEKSWARYGGHNDGGQSHGGHWGSSWPKWQAASKQHEMGDIVAYGAGRNYVYACGDITAAYSSKKMRRYLRHFLFLRPDTVVIYDAVTATQGAYKKTWHLHLFGKPTVTKQDQGTLCVGDNGAGRLYCLSLLPEKYRTEVISGFVTEGVTHPATKAGLNPWYRYDVVAETGQATHVFLNVLKATSSSDSVAPQCTMSEVSGRIKLTIAGRGTVTIPKSGALGWTLATGGATLELPTRIERASGIARRARPAARAAAAKPPAPKRPDDPLAAYAAQIASARQMAATGEFLAASAEIRKASDGATGDAKVRLEQFAGGFQATGTLRDWIIRGVTAGREKTVFVQVAGRLSRTRLVGADRVGITVRAMGNEFPIPWNEIPSRRLRAIAQKYAPPDDTEAKRTLRIFKMAFEPDALGRPRSNPRRSAKWPPTQRRKRTRRKIANRAAHAFVTRSTGRGAPVPLKGPFLQFPSDPSRRSVTVAWETKTASEGFVRYRSGAQGWRKVSAPQRSRRHEVVLSDLTPAVLYEYEVGGDVNARGTILLPAERQDQLRFVVIGDPRAYDEVTLALTGQVIRDRPDFVLATGDYVGKAGDPVRANWVECFTSYKDLFNNVPFFPAVGDHDDIDGGAEYRENFVLPGEEMYYSFDWGRCHFVSLWVSWPQKWKPGSAQYQWLEKDLQAARGKYDFIFAYYHLPMATVGNYAIGKGNTARARRTLLPLFKKYGVQASFGGHDHNYQHWEIEGHTFVLTGGFNRNNLYAIREELKKSEMAAGTLKQALKVSHYVLVEVKGKKATFTIKGEGKKTIDQFTIHAR